MNISEMANFLKNGLDDKDKKALLASPNERAQQDGALINIADSNYLSQFTGGQK
ncbi:MAG: hypothetical protein NY202_04840 [Mollicutes bacterium UO1]